VTKFLVAGATGLVGSAVLDKLNESGQAAVGISSRDADLRNFGATLEVIKKYRPTCIIDAAAKVGGIKYNNDFPVEFLLDNLAIQNNLMQAAHQLDVEKFVFLGSSCIYPKYSAQPIREEYLMTGPLESTNSAYAMAKIAGIELIKSYRRQYGRRWISLMPTNIFGPFDNFSEVTGHVIPALITKFVRARELQEDTVEVWGTGNARREFLFSQDLAESILFCADNYDNGEPLNIGTGKDLSIKELAELISRIVEFKGEIVFNHDYPDGTPRKLLDVSRVNCLGWKASTTLEDGLTTTIKWYLDQRRDGLRL
jgi:GDP-L-fucose synthase